MQNDIGRMRRRIATVLSALITALLLTFASPAAARVWPETQIDDLVRAAAEAPQEGLPLPAGLGRLISLAHDADTDARLAPERDAAADALFAGLAHAYAQGGVDPRRVDPDWRLPVPDAPDLVALHSALDAGALPSTLLTALLPQHAEYQALRRDLAAQTGDDADAIARRDQLSANLERWRWLPRALPERRVEVRIAQFELFFHDAAAAPARYAAIVGARRTPSPVFSAVITSFTVNPDWTPPASILLQELLPRFARDPDAAAREGFEALDADGRVVTGEIDWRARPFPYRLRQRPGRANALGQLRFDLPNPYAVYLHDTPNRRLFARDARALSHGCIRVEHPIALAAQLAAPALDEAAIETAIAAETTQTIPLALPTPVYVLYLTAFASPDGAVTLVDDIYRRDARLSAALAAVTLDAPAPQLVYREHGRTCAPSSGR